MAHVFQMHRPYLTPPTFGITWCTTMIKNCYMWALHGTLYCNFCNHTDRLKVAEGTLGTAVVHHISQGEQSECITLLEDRVAWLMDWHDHYPVVDTAQAVDSKVSVCITVLTVQFCSDWQDWLYSWYCFLSFHFTYTYIIITSSLYHHYEKRFYFYACNHS